MANIKEKHLEKGADVNRENSQDGFFALLIAAQNGHSEIVRLLIEAGANIHKKYHSGETALSVAIKNEHTECAKLLRKSGMFGSAVLRYFSK